MLRNADTAMYQAKALGGNAVAVFDASMRERVARRLLLENEMHQALERGELHLCYQPIVRLGLGSGGRPRGAAAVVASRPSARSAPTSSSRSPRTPA